MGIEQRPLPPRPLPREPAAQPKSEHVFARIPRDLKRWPETNGYPPISGASGIEQYYEEFLRRAHPSMSEEQLKAQVENGLKDEALRIMLEALQRADEEMRQIYPGYTRWFDLLPPRKPPKSGE